MSQLSRNAGLLLVRFALSAWVGAATLFVINGIRLVTSSAFDAADRDHMALLRFSSYYIAGGILLTLAVIGFLMVRSLPSLSFRRWAFGFVITLLAAAVMLGDYFWIYLPLTDMIIPPGVARPARFHDLHQASEIVNTLQVGLCLLASCVVSWPTE